MTSENIIQSEIFKWYHNNFCTTNCKPQHIIFSVPNGGTRNKLEAITMKATGLVSGISDLIVVKPDEVVFVEVKNEIGIQSENQKNFQKKIEAMGYRYLLIRSLNEFKEKI